MFSIKLWLAERKQQKIARKIRLRYVPLIEKAKKAKDDNELHSLLSNMRFESETNDGADILRTQLFIKRARRLNLPVPKRPDIYAEDFSDGDANWDFNQTDGELYLSDEALLQLERDIRKEEMERLEHTMRWVNRVVLPLIGLFISLSGLIGTIVGYIAVKHGLKIKP